MSKYTKTDKIAVLIQTSRDKHLNRCVDVIKRRVYIDDDGVELVKVNGNFVELDFVRKINDVMVYD